MPAPASHPHSTHDLTHLARRAARGDQAARNELFVRSGARVAQMARRMLRRNPAVARWAEADDLIANVSVRLLRALETTRVTDTRGFFSLTATVMRRELIDLARKFFGPEGVGAHHASRGLDGPTAHPPVEEPDPADLERWAAFHEAVEGLPPPEREVFGLVFYHKRTHVQIAEVLRISERGVRRRFKEAARLLNEALGGRFPGE